eukprot:CAMPEP_0183312850 /NCGR_PEP_ID=MMETSP0160_2-20130417/43293_1 /TAXON_ID=2839 ORGANISM="Odontella Sinensis, Strain Grunow 1884" /NCGR_SAMPLE_ID=MMETSP0160_2 /ASSEMBLY_ACC=CAM_ASM_000250 /LENGTH=68 /DNA_ID=CAMNT_0025477793 /DNA_START=15 /DNA_END=221 /DNA_ORIENTATION=+
MTMTAATPTPGIPGAWSCSSQKLLWPFPLVLLHDPWRKRASTSFVPKGGKLEPAMRRRFGFGAVMVRF